MYVVFCDYQWEDDVQESSEGEKSLLSKSVKKELWVKSCGLKGQVGAVPEFDGVTQQFLHSLSFMHRILNHTRSKSSLLDSPLSSNIWFEIDSQESFECMVFLNAQSVWQFAAHWGISDFFKGYNFDLQ